VIAFHDKRNFEYWLKERVVCRLSQAFVNQIRVVVPCPLLDHYFAARIIAMFSMDLMLALHVAYATQEKFLIRTMTDGLAEK